MEEGPLLPQHSVSAPCPHPGKGKRWGEGCREAGQTQLSRDDIRMRNGTCVELPQPEREGHSSQPPAPYFLLKNILNGDSHKCQIHSHCISKLESCQKLSDGDLQEGSQKGIRERRRPCPCRGGGRGKAWLQFQISQRA